MVLVTIQDLSLSTTLIMTAFMEKTPQEFMIFQVMEITEVQLEGVHQGE